MKVAVQDLAEAKLLDEIVLGSEHGCCSRAAIQQLIHPIRRGSTECQLDPIGRQERLQRLDCREMAAGLIAYMHREIGKILGRADGRTGWNENAARRDV